MKYILRHHRGGRKEKELKKGDADRAGGGPAATEESEREREVRNQTKSLIIRSGKGTYFSSLASWYYIYLFTLLFQLPAMFGRSSEFLSLSFYAPPH